MHLLQQTINRTGGDIVNYFESIGIVFTSITVLVAITSILVWSIDLIARKMRLNFQILMWLTHRKQFKQWMKDNKNGKKTN